MGAFGGFAPLPIRLGGNDRDGLTAPQWSRVTADMTAIVNSSRFAVVTYTKSGADHTLHSHNSQLYVGTSTDAIDAAGNQFVPVFTDLGTGLTKITWATGYQDSYENSYPVNITGARATAHGSVVLAAVIVDTTPNSVTVAVRDSTDALTDAKVSVSAW